MRLYYFRDRLGKGTAPLPDIQAAIANGTLSDQTQVSLDGENWQSANGPQNADFESDILPMRRTTVRPYNPPELAQQQPMQQPVQHVVVVKSGCGRAMTWLLVLFLLFGVFIVVTCNMGVNAVNEARQKKSDAAQELEIVNFVWRKGGFGSIMEADFGIRNNGSKAMKDIDIVCSHYSASGTKVDSTSRTIYEVIEPGETRTFEGFNMGFIHSQANTSTASITSAEEVE